MRLAMLYLVFGLMVNNSLIINAQTNIIIDIQQIRTYIASKIKIGIEKSFEDKTVDTTVIEEQAALIQFELNNSIVDTFYIWSNKDTKISNWLVRYINPLIGKKIPKADSLRYIVLPVITFDPFNDNMLQSKDVKFTESFSRLFGDTQKSKTIMLIAEYLDCPWGDVIKNYKNDYHRTDETKSVEVKSKKKCN